MRTAPRVVANFKFSRRISKETLRRIPKVEHAVDCWEWPVGLQRTSCSSPTGRTMWCSRSTCAPTDSMRATCTERWAASSGWRGVQRRVGHTVRRHVARTTRMSASDRSPAQTTVGLCVAKWNSRPSRADGYFCAFCATGVCSSRRSALTESIVPRAERPVDSELHSTHITGTTLGVRRAARRQRDSTGRCTFKTGRWPSFVWTQTATCSSYRTPHFPAPDFPLFCGGTLLVGVGKPRSPYGIHEAVSFSIRGGRLQRDRHLMAWDKRLEIANWWLVDETLYVREEHSADIILYNSNWMWYLYMENTFPFGSFRWILLNYRYSTSTVFCTVPLWKVV